MSYYFHTHNTATSSSNFQQIFNKALKAYESRTEQDLLAHPLTAQLQACDSPHSIFLVLQQQAEQLKRSQISDDADDRLTVWLDPTVYIIYAISAMLGEGVGMVCSKIWARDICTLIAWLTGIFTCERHLRRSRCPPFSLYPS